MERFACNSTNFRVSNGYCQLCPHLYIFKLLELIYVFSLFSNHGAALAGLYLVPKMVVYPTSCFCKHMQTATSEVVQGSYIPTADAEQQIKLTVFHF